MRELYEVENKGKAEPSGSQDMIGLVYPGVNRLDYDFKIHGGVFPSHIESCNSAEGRALVEQGSAFDSRRAAARTATVRWASKISSRNGLPSSANLARIATTPS